MSDYAITAFIWTARLLFPRWISRLEMEAAEEEAFLERLEAISRHQGRIASDAGLFVEDVDRSRVKGVPASVDLHSVQGCR